MIVNELAYKVTVQADEFLNGKRQVEEGANAMRNNLRRTSNETNAALGSLSGGLQNFGDKGKQAFSGVQLGAAKFLGVALSLEGARRMFTSTTRDLVQLGNMSGFLGMSAKSLDGFNRAAEAAGVSGGSLASSLGRIKNAQLWSKTGMGAPDESTVATMQLQGMTGVDIIGAKDPGQGLLRQAEALRKLSRDQAQVMWQRSGGADDMFDTMYSGNLKTLQADFEKRSNATDPAIKRAREVNQTLTELNATVDSLGQKFVEAFGKDVNDALKEFGDWVENNKDNVLGFFREGADWAKQFADALNGSSNALHAFFQITDNFNLLSGFQKPLIDIGGQGKSTPGQRLTAGGNLEADSPLGMSWDYVSGMWKQKENRKAEYNQPKGLTPGATNPEAAMAPPTQGGWDAVWAMLGLSPAGAASVSPTLRRGMSMDRGANPQLLNALMMTESGGNPLAYNAKSGAAGAYQFMPATARDMGLQVGGGVDERLDPEKSRAAANSYLSQLLKRYKGNVSDALQAYNWGMGNMDKYISGGRTGFIPKETQDYPGKVASYYQRMASGAMSGNKGSGSIDQSSSNATTIGQVNVYSNPTSADQLTQSVQEQASRSQITVAFSSGVK